MAGLVEKVAPDFEDALEWSVVVTKTRSGALRYRELVKENGRRLPIPAILINARLEYDVIPPEEDLRARLTELSLTA